MRTASDVNRGPFIFYNLTLISPRKSLARESYGFNKLIGAFERFFRPEGKMSDNVCALPVVSSKLRLYCLRLSDKILILGNGGVKKTRTYNEDDELKGYVLTLQKFDRLIKEGVEDGTITVTENTLETDKTFDL